MLIQKGGAFILIYTKDYYDYFHSYVWVPFILWSSQRTSSFTVTDNVQVSLCRPLLASRMALPCLPFIIVDLRQEEADSWHRLIVHRPKCAQLPRLTTLLFQTHKFIQHSLRNAYMQDRMSELAGYRLLLDPLVLASEEAVQGTASSLPSSTLGPRHSGRWF